MPFLALGLVVSVVVGVSGWKQIDSMSARAVADVIRLLEGRSPGERGEATLVKTQRERALGKSAPPVAAADPQERVLGKVFPPDTAPTYPGDLIDGLIPELPPEPVFELAQIPPLWPLGGFPLEAVPGVPGIIGGGGGPGGGGGGGGSGGGNSPPPVIVTPPAAVPEPATWTFMLVGAFLCGAALRRRKRTKLSTELSPCVLGS